MKSSIIALLLLCTTTLFAQRGTPQDDIPKWEAGAGAGTLLDAHQNKFISAKNSYQKNRFSVMYGVYIARNLKLWQFGVSVDVMKLDGESVGDYLMYSPYYVPYKNDNYDYNKRINTAAPAIPAQLFINRKFTHTKFSPYAGVAAGYIFCHRPEINIDTLYRAVNYSGLAFGVHMGASYSISPNLAVNAELADRNMRLYLNGPFMRYALSATVGLKYYF